MMLRCKELAKGYSNKNVVNNVSLELEEGSIYALLGQNGSGKSTLMKMIAGLVKADQGDVTLQGVNIGTQTKGSISYMPTELYFYDYMKIKDVESYYADFYQDFNKERFQAFLKRFELDMKSRVKNMSTGEVAKLKLAVTLSRDAKLYLLDEPLNGVDLISRDRIITSILEVSNVNNTIVIASHLMDELENIIDQVILINKGDICLLGDAEELREQHGKSIVNLYREVLA